MLRRIKLYVNTSKEKALRLSDEVRNSLIKNGYEIVHENADLVIGFGGDGTLLKWLNEQCGCPKEKYLGINCGTLGFMQDFEVDDVEKFVKNIPCYVEKQLYYLTVVLKFNGNEKLFHMINDVNILNAEDKTFRANVNIDGEFLETYVGTGLIFATPMGSTARNISSVGSIMFPEINAIQMTPIEPIVNSKIHCLAKSICIPNNKEISLRPVNTDKIKIMSDGICVYEDSFDEIHISLSGKYMTTLTEEGNSFVKKIREKLI